LSKQSELMNRIRRTPRGIPFAIQRWADVYGPSVANKAVTALVAAGDVTRLQRGVYVRPRRHAVLGTVTPPPEAAIKVAARARGHRIEIGGPDALRRFGLTTQVPLQTTFLTSGKSRTVDLPRRRIRLEHAPRAFLAYAGTPVGAALSALREIGPDHLTPAALQHVLMRLEPTDRHTLLRHARRLPRRMARALDAAARQLEPA
jgi:hypothetical protein